MTFRDLKVGDLVLRRIGGSAGQTMRMVVVALGKRLAYCDAAGTRPLTGQPLSEHWKFDRELGCEEDEDLGWGRASGVTGSQLELEDP